MDPPPLNLQPYLMFYFKKQRFKCYKIFYIKKLTSKSLKLQTKIFQQFIYNPSNRTIDLNILLSHLYNFFG